MRCPQLIFSKFNIVLVTYNVIKHQKISFQMVFKAKRSRKQMEAAEAARDHRLERQSVRRSASGLQKKKLAPKFFMGKRVA
jgi:hypothetical protein